MRSNGHARRAAFGACWLYNCLVPGFLNLPSNQRRLFS
ncbi:hypothetical protein NC651_019067 [Populus alba x Populus x berolinensis]|nr:hypothetical protein NC651_019067 [Populus alba x Populus x berolinensis]